MSLLKAQRATTPSATAKPSRREFLQGLGLTFALAPLALGMGCSLRSGQNQDAASLASLDPWPDFPWQETTIQNLQLAFSQGRTTTLSLTKDYLRRIKALNRQGPTLRAVIELNPDALAMARALDHERNQGQVRGPLHGIPVLIKDNIATHDRMTTTAGSLALEGSLPPQDAFLVQQLRQAGAVLLGKANLSEWANFRGRRSSSGWSARGGQTRHPDVLNRNPSGSSSGSAVAVAANMCVVAIGTETDGSIMSPSAVCGVVGIKPTVGLISRSGIIPISQSQDTAGPIARTVADAAITLGVLAGADPQDPITTKSPDQHGRDYTKFLNPNGLQGARLGVVRRYFQGSTARLQELEDALAAMEAAGAVLVDPVSIDSLDRLGDAEWIVLQYEFKEGLNRYFASLGPEAPVKSLQELIEFNKRHHQRELSFFGQETLESSQAKGPLTDQVYQDALAKCRRLTRQEGIDAVMDEHRLDALVAPSGGPAGTTDLLYGNHGVGGSSRLAAVSGYPNITVPAGQVHGLPLGMAFFGRAYSEPTLIQLAYAFEQATQHRCPPRFLPQLPEYPHPITPPEKADPPQRTG